MNKKCLILLPLLLLVGCGMQNEGSTPNSLESTSVVSNNFIGEVEEGFEYSYDFSYNVLSRITDIINGAYLPKEEEYMLDFSFSTTETKGYTITLSNENVAGYRIDENDKPWLICKEVGDSILVIKDSLGIIHFRYVIHVREKLTKEGAQEYLINVDYFKSQAPFWSGGEYDMTFVSASTCYFNSYVEGEVVEQLAFTYEFDSMNSEAILYKVTAIEPLSQTIKITSFELDITGFEIRPFDNTGLFDIFRPVSNSQK